MDLHFHGHEADDDERAAVDALLGAATSGWHGGERDMARESRVSRGGLPTSRDQRHLLLPALHALQDRVGWVSPGGLEYVCRRLAVPPAEAWGVVTFYHLFATEARPKRVVHVCDDLACRLRGAERLCDQLAEEHGPAGTTTPNGGATWIRSPCLGQCERAPVALAIDAGATPAMRTLADLTSISRLSAALESATHSLAELVSPPPAADLRRSVPQVGEPGLELLRRVGTVDPTSLEEYRESGGYAALARAIELGPDGVIRELIASKLVGRGGAAFPTGRKWEAVARQAARPKYLVLNADESEPGTFKDRVLLEEDPFAVVEAMTIAAFACGIEHGYVYLRGEYPLARRRLEDAIATARAEGLLGDDVVGAGFAFDIELRRGAGAYICGEETALFNSLEGKRGEPRSKPPFPVEVGLFGKPTLINNVETLANLPRIVLEGGAAFAGETSGSSTGTKLFCVSGRVERPGLYEVPFGETLGDLLARAGGVAGGRRLEAILLGGAAGMFVGPEALAAPLTFEGTRAIGATLGSGVVLIYDDRADLPDALLRIAEFFRHESCGQCVPCRVGTVRQEELLHRLRSGETIGTRADELALFAELAQAMRDASICGLGQTAASAIESAIVKLGVFGRHAAESAATVE